MVNSYRQPEPFFEIFFGDHGGIFWCSGFIRHGVKLHDRPPAEVYFVQRVNHRRQVYLATAEFYPAIRTLRMIRILHWFDILYMQEEQALGMLFNRLHWISASLEIVGDVELQLYITGIGCGQHALESIRVLANRPHVVVIAKPD